MAEIEIGIVKHYFGKINVAALEITSGELSVGDTIHIKGHTSDFNLAVDSMQVEHEKVQSVKTGDQVGIKVPEKAHENDKVYKVTD